MATQLKPGNDDNIPVANIAARQDRITDTFKRMYDIDQRIDEQKAEHIKPLQDDRKKLTRDLKADTEIDNKDLTLWYKIYKRQQDAKAMDEEEDKNRILDNLKETYEALSKGGQLDFITAASSNVAEAAPQAAE